MPPVHRCVQWPVRRLKRNLKSALSDHRRSLIKLFKYRQSGSCLMLKRFSKLTLVSLFLAMASLSACKKEGQESEASSQKVLEATKIHGKTSFARVFLRKSVTEFQPLTKTRSLPVSTILNPQSLLRFQMSLVSSFRSAFTSPAVLKELWIFL